MIARNPGPRHDQRTFQEGIDGGMFLFKSKYKLKYLYTRRSVRGNGLFKNDTLITSDSFNATTHLLHNIIFSIFPVKQYSFLENTLSCLYYIID